MHTNADAMSRKPKRSCQFDDCRDCKKADSTIENGVVKDNFKPDAICNIPDSEDSESLNPNWLSVWTHEELVQLQKQDSCITEILRLKQRFINKPPKSEILQTHKDTITLWHQWEILGVHNDLLYRQIENDLGAQKFQLLAPREIRDVIFTHLHEQRYAAHFGLDCTSAMIKKRFYWPGMNEDIARWCKECQLCARKKPGPGKGKSELQQFKVNQPMSVIAVDIL